MVAQVDDVEMKDKDVEHPEDHHDQHEFLAQSRIVAPPYFEAWFWDGCNMYRKIRQKGTIISAWWRLLGGGRITIPILYMGVDIHVNDFSAGFSKDVSGKV